MLLVIITFHHKRLLVLKRNVPYVKKNIFVICLCHSNKVWVKLEKSILLKKLLIVHFSKIIFGVGKKDFLNRCNMLKFF